MPSRYAFILGFAILLSGCGAPHASPAKDGATSSVAASIKPFSGSTLNLRYTVTDAAVRRSLVRAGRNFQIDLRDGMFEFPADWQMQPWNRAVLQQKPVLVTDLNGDDIEDEATVLTMGSGDASVSEIVIILSTSGAPVHAASYALGHAEVTSLSFKNGEIHAGISRRFPGDPGPRRLEIVFALPEGITGSGAVRQ